MRRIVIDPWFLIPAIALSVFGLGLHIFLQGGIRGPAALQFLWFLIGVAAFFFVTWARPIQIKTFALPLYLVSLLLLAATLVVGTGAGVKRWIEFGPVNLQASELAKPLLIAFLATLGEEYESRRHPLALAALLTLVTFVPFFLVFKEPDLGTAVVYLAICVGAVYAISRIRIKHVLISLAVVSVLAVPAWEHLKPYQRDRVLAFLRPQDDPLGAGYQPLQSQMAIGSGGLFGKGFTEESRRALTYLPGRQTDFVFAVLGRTTGLAGSLAALLLYIAILFRLFRYADSADEPFVRFFTMAAGFYLGFQAFINIAVALGIAPVTGIPLPFISQGGSGMLAAWLALGGANAGCSSFRSALLRRTREARIV